MSFIDYLTSLEGPYHRYKLSLPRRNAASVPRLKAVERELGLALPKDLRAAWRTTNGLGKSQTVFARPGRLTGYEFLAVEAALKEREGLRRRAPSYSKYREPGTRDARSRAGWFEPGWLPFAGFGGGTLLLILDLAPASPGTPGQIIAFTHDPDQIEYIAPSFAAQTLKNFSAHPESAVLSRNAPPSVFHQRHIGRMLRSS
jgi:cell wall assembly regulator SMI1